MYAEKIKSQTKDNERWKSDGDCRKCRRDPYCTKPCKARKKNVKKFLLESSAESVAAAMAKAFGKKEEKKEGEAE